MSAAMGRVEAEMHLVKKDDEWRLVCMGEFCRYTPHPCDHLLSGEFGTFDSFTVAPPLHAQMYASMCASAHTVRSEMALF